MEKTEDDFQKYPAFDNDVIDGFEAIVEAYYQSLGYITSTDKCFWCRQGKKQCRK